MSDGNDNTYHDPHSPFSQGWACVKACNEALSSKDYTSVRKQMAAYFKLGIVQPGKLHSAILSIAVKLGTLCPDFHLVPFLDMWGLQNLRPEDSETRMDENGKRIPSLVERLSKTYAYAILFHPDEHIEKELEELFFRLLLKKGFLGEVGPKVCPLLATKLIQKETNGRKMTFVNLIAQDGAEFITEIHQLTTFQYFRYDDIPGMVFDTLLRTSAEKGKIRIEAAIPTKSNIEDFFPTKIGYVEHIDLGHGYTHIYDCESRHLVADHSRIQAKVGDYVAFTPIIPMISNFKTAIIRKVFPSAEGPQAFGLRKVKVTFKDEEKGYCAWELLPAEDGNIHPIVEVNTTEPSYTKGYINKLTSQALNKELPSVGAEIYLVTFLKRGKDKQKRPQVVYFQS